MAQSRGECPVCLGEGFKIRDVDQCVFLPVWNSLVFADRTVIVVCRCKKCKGEKTTKEKKKFVWEIKRGMRHGEPVILKGEGDRAVGLFRLLLVDYQADPLGRLRSSLISLAHHQETSSSSCSKSRIPPSSRARQTSTTF